ncbi:MAG: hypothetical protein KBS91_02570, partial [Firmicutes bacterium]|nr:hypothetical protein [Candidatus Caballimonas caccae]
FIVNSIRNNTKRKKNSDFIFTLETLGVVLLLFSALSLVCLITYDKVFSIPGALVADLLTGVFGYFSVAVSLFIFLEGLLMLLGKKINISVRHKVMFTLISFFVVLLLHVISMREYSYLPYGEYLSKSYELGADGLKGSSAGGIILSLVSYFFSLVLTNVGAYVIISLLIAFSLFLFIRDFSTGNKSASSSKFRTSFVKEDKSIVDLDNLAEKEYPIENVEFEEPNIHKNNGQILFVNNPEGFSFKSKRDLRKGDEDKINIDYGVGGLGVANTSYQKAYTQEMESKINYIKTPASINISETLKNNLNKESDINISKPITESYEDYNKDSEHLVKDIEEEQSIEEIPFSVHDESVKSDSASEHARDFSSKYIDIPEDDTIASPIEDHVSYPIEENNFNE